MPNYCENLVLFSLKGKEDRYSLTSDTALQLVDNLKALDGEAFSTDLELTKEIEMKERQGHDAKLGIVLILTNENCRKCESKLYIRTDRPATVTVYDDAAGTLPGTHYTRYCIKKGCSFQQHYGYYTIGESEVRFDVDWQWRSQGGKRGNCPPLF